MISIIKPKLDGMISVFSGSFAVLYRIGTSEPAVKFEVIEKPNDRTKEVKKNKSANETQRQRYDYWGGVSGLRFPKCTVRLDKRRHAQNEKGVQKMLITCSVLKRRYRTDEKVYKPIVKDEDHLIRSKDNLDRVRGSTRDENNQNPDIIEREEYDVDDLRSDDYEPYHYEERRI